MAPFCHLHISSFHFPMSSSRISSVYMTIWARQPPVWGMARPQGCAKGKDAWCHVWDGFWEDEAPLCDAARWSGSGMVRSGSMAGWNSFVACTMVGTKERASIFPSATWLGAVIRSCCRCVFSNLAKNSRWGCFGNSWRCSSWYEKAVK